ncbi:cation-translocating P-type ATPase [Candidatus Bathyarchaeota archaeon]|nr:cation-translocating P-type ATPase [Candidatus Bathyarchaeota archaeon]
MSQKLTRLHLANIFRLFFISAVAFVAIIGIITERLGLLEAVLERIPAPIALVAVLLGGYPIFRSAYNGFRAKLINVDLLMSFGIIGAAVIGEFIASALIAFFMNIAHSIERFTVKKSREAIKELVKLAPKTAHVKRDGQEIEIKVEELAPGDIVIVKPGESIPADGIVISGLSSVNQAPVTGESIPVEKKTGDKVFAGTINGHGVLQVKVLKVGEDTTLGRIITLVEEAIAHKSRLQIFADKFTTYFLPIVIVAVGLTYLLSQNIVYAVAVLVVACPCSVALATPLAVVASAGNAAKKGLLIKGGLYLEALAKVEVIAVDKTGTLTIGKPNVTDIITFGESEKEVIRLAAAVEKYSEHPLATAILEKAKALNINVNDPEKFMVLPGKGIIAEVQHQRILLGNSQLIEERGIKLPTETLRKIHEMESQGKTVLLLTRNSHVVGLIAVADMVRGEVPKAIEKLKKLGIKRFVLLTGDNERVAAAVAKQLGISEYKANMLPEDKIEYVKALQAQGLRVAMIGDGVNDTPALAQADVGIAMGAAGTDIAIEAAHVVLMQDNWEQIPEAIRIGRKTYNTIKQNITFGILFNLIGMSLASIGVIGPILGSALESLPDVFVFLNSSKLLRE